jgi:hypothetical protein
MPLRPTLPITELTQLFRFFNSMTSSSITSLLWWHPAVLHWSGRRTTWAAITPAGEKEDHMLSYIFLPPPCACGVLCIFSEGADEEDGDIVGGCSIKGEGAELHLSYPETR